MLNDKIKERLDDATSLEEVKDILKDSPELDAERLYQELENHRSSRNERLDLDELDAVSGGADRDWKKDGCAATCEPASWCGTNDQCLIFDVTYDNFWVCCPDGHDHVFKNYICTRCGYEMAHYPDEHGPR